MPRALAPGGVGLACFLVSWVSAVGGQGPDIAFTCDLGTCVCNHNDLELGANFTTALRATRGQEFQMAGPTKQSIYVYSLCGAIDSSVAGLPLSESCIASIEATPTAFVRFDRESGNCTESLPLSSRASPAAVTFANASGVSAHWPILRLEYTDATCPTNQNFSIDVTLEHSPEQQDCTQDPHASFGTAGHCIEWSPSSWAGRTLATCTPIPHKNTPLDTTPGDMGWREWLWGWRVVALAVGVALLLGVGVGYCRTRSTDRGAGLGHTLLGEDDDATEAGSF